MVDEEGRKNGVGFKVSVHRTMDLHKLADRLQKSLFSLDVVDKVMLE